MQRRSMLTTGLALGLGAWGLSGCAFISKQQAAAARTLSDELAALEIQSQGRFGLYVVDTVSGAEAGSGAVKRQAEAEGIASLLVDAGFEWREPGCSMCLAMNGDILAADFGHFHGIGHWQGLGIDLRAADDPDVLRELAAQLQCFGQAGGAQDLVGCRLGLPVLRQPDRRDCYWSAAGGLYRDATAGTGLAWESASRWQKCRPRPRSGFRVAAVPPPAAAIVLCAQSFAPPRATRPGLRRSGPDRGAGGETAACPGVPLDCGYVG